MTMKRLTRRGFIIGASGVVLGAASPARAGQGVALSGRAFGGAWRVVLGTDRDAQALADEIGKVLSAIDRVFSPFRPDSALSRFNRAATTGWVDVGATFSSVAAEALRVAAISGGAFDPSVGPDVARYGFGPIAGSRAGSYKGFEVGEGRLRKGGAGLSLDLCGIAKGHAVSAVASCLEAHGVADFLIEIGGEVTARGLAPSGDAWRIGIADPVAGGVHARITADGLAFATSGDAVNAYEVAGRRYSHTIDPATGEPVENGVASVTVGAADGAMADALATAFLVMGPGRGLELAGRLGLPVLYLMRGEAGVVARSNPQFDALRLA